MKRDRSTEPVPPLWLAQFLAAVRAMHPLVDLSRPVVEKLRPFFESAYRGNLAPVAAAKRTCSRCKEILTGSIQEIARPIVRPPRGAKPTEAFGAEELRESASVERWRKQLAKAQAESQRADTKRQEQLAKASAARSERTKQAAVDRAEGFQIQQAEAEESVSRLRLLLSGGAPQRTAAPRRPRPAVACPPKNPACSLGLLGGTCGLPASLVLAAAQGSPVPRTARYCLASAQRLIPSHNPQKGFVPNRDYPSDVQERAYDRDKGEQLKVIGAAQNLLPELIFNTSPGVIDGLPVVTDDGIVLGGNGRTQALQLHYANGGRSARDYLAEHAREFGFSKNQILAVADPMVVRVLETPPPNAREYKRTLQELVRLLNVPLTKSLDIQSEAVAEARRLSDEMLDVLAVAFQDDVSLADYLASPASRTLVQALRRAGIVTDRNAVKYLNTEGLLSPDGRQLVERVLTAALVPEALLLDAIGPQTRTALARSAPFVLAAASYGGEWDIRAALVRALRDFTTLRTYGFRDVESFLRQQQLGGERPQVEGDPIGQLLLRLLGTSGNAPLRLSKLFRQFTDQARRNPTGQGALFSVEAETGQSALRTLVRNEI